MRNNGEMPADIKLDIAVNYPIYWGFDKIMRDVVQNFYDVLGADAFNKELEYRITEADDDTLSLYIGVDGHSFSYDMLSYIGASTKRDDKNSIGMFGEGFKMAALSVYKMGSIHMVMHSNNWSITPTSYYVSVGEEEIEMLGYSLIEDKEDGKTSLTMTGIPRKQRSVLNDVLLEFCYPENKLFGRLIGRGEKYEVYSRSKKKIPCRDDAADIEGVLYVNNLARGRLDIPIIVNYKLKLKEDDRSRPTMSKYDTAALLYICMEKWDPKTSAKVLKIMKKWWGQLPASRFNDNANYYYICQLVRNISKDKAARKQFEKEIKDCYYIEKKTLDNKRNALIDEAKKRFRTDRPGVRLVNPIFRLLGAKNVVDEYVSEKATRYTPPGEIASERYKIVFRCVAGILPLFEENDMPELVMDDSRDDPIPVLYSTRLYDKQSRKLHRKYRLDKIVMANSDFRDDAFNETFIKISDIMLQVYGTPRSAVQNAVLTEYGGVILENRERVEASKQEWNRYIAGSKDNA